MTRPTLWPGAVLTEDHRPAEEAGPILSALEAQADLSLPASFVCSFSPERTSPRGSWGPGPGGAVTPLLFWKLLQVPVHQRPGSWVTSVLSRVWFPGVAGSSLGLFWDHHKFHPPPVNGEFSSNSLEGVMSLPNYRGGAGRGHSSVTSAPCPGETPACHLWEGSELRPERTHGDAGQGVHLGKSKTLGKSCFFI